jgi:hypothetical protein
MASTTADITTDAGDNRRAATLTVHYGRGDTAGVNAVLAETVDVDRVTALYLAVLNLHREVIPKLYTVDGLACLTDLVYTLAGDDNADPDCKRAARMIVAHSSGDVAGFNAVLDEVAESYRGSELLIGMYATFSAFVPVLYSEAGLSVLQRSVLNWVAAEEGPT